MRIFSAVLTLLFAAAFGCVPPSVISCETNESGWLLDRVDVETKIGDAISK